MKKGSGEGRGVSGRMRSVLGLGKELGECENDSGKSSRKGQKRSEKENWKGYSG